MARAACERKVRAHDSCYGSGARKHLLQQRISPSARPMSLPPTPPRIPRRYPIGAEVCAGDVAAFRVWAPARRRVSVVVESDAAAGEFDLTREGNGYFSGRRPGTPPGALYR